MNPRGEDHALSLMNAAVAMVILIPLLLLMWEQSMHNKQGSGREDDQPPIITVSEAEVYSFASGKAQLSPQFKGLLTGTIVPKLEKLAADYRCDIIEVIGHTDEQSIGLASNLDTALLSVINGKSVTLIAGSNLDLGLMRAWSVASLLKSDGRLAGKKIYGYSAGQIILPGGNIAAPAKDPKNDPSRRRIEIRMRRSK